MVSWDPCKQVRSHKQTSFGFNANGCKPLEKLKLKCQIGDLKVEVTCYVIDVDTFYNLWKAMNPPQPHPSLYITSMHEASKWRRECKEEKKPFKGVENYSTDALLY